MPPKDAIRLRHMIEAAEQAAVFLVGRVREDMERDAQFAFALCRAIEIFGEAAAKISAATRQALPSVPWALAIGMRNRIAHAYFDINYDVVWSTAEKELPPLVPALRAALSPEPR